MHRVVIVGGGFGGLYTATALGRAEVELTLVDRSNYHLFQPLLYQVATGGISPANICAPLRAVLKRQRNTRVLMGEVVDFDLVEKRVLLADGVLPYDTLVAAVGVTHHYFGHDEWEARAPGLKTIEDATRIRGRILSAFERAERATDEDERRRLLTFVVVGGGPTGVELAGAIGELARHTLRSNFRRIDPRDARVLLVEGTDRLLGGFPRPLSERAARSLERLGVTVLTGTMVADLGQRQVTLESGDRRQVERAATVLWAAGVQAVPLLGALARRASANTDRAGRIEVEADCSLPGHPEVFVIGDAAHLKGADGELLPGTAPVAMQQGRHVGGAIVRRLAGRPVGAFRYRDRGSLAVIGRAAAVARIGRWKFSGYPAWLLWLFIHILYLVEFENRILVAAQWGYSYFTRNRGARLITDR